LVATESSFLPFLEVEEYVEFFKSTPDVGKVIEAAGPEQYERFEVALRQVFTQLLLKEGKISVFGAYIVVAQKPI
jgi:hypothetical protein